MRADEEADQNRMARSDAIRPQNKTVQMIEREEVQIMQSPTVRLTRKQLYDEIWELSASGTAKKYGIPYAWFLKQVKDADIPIPPSGYWTKLSFGKTIEKTALSGSEEEVLSLTKKRPVPEKKKRNPMPKEEPRGEKSTAETDTERAEQKPTEMPMLAEGEKQENEKAVQEPVTIEQWGRTYNVYDRETLYREVWEAPVTDVAKKYKVSDVAIHKVCKSLEIPTPPAGYWAKRRAGKPVVKIPLPKSDKAQKKTGVQTGNSLQTEEAEQTLAFLEEEERAVVMTVAAQILLPDEKERMHPQIIACRKAAVEWEKANRARDNRWRPNNASEPPKLAEEIATESVPRACRIADALIKAMEPLGCELTGEMNFIVNGETVIVAFSESKDKVEHVLTKEENRQLLIYEEERKKYTYATRPQIRKYDYRFNGRLALMINGKKTFRDCRSYQLENRLGDMMIELYAAAEMLKQQRLAREEAERKRQEELRRREERRKKYNAEVERTLALTHAAEDYEIACKIRRYIQAYEAVHAGQEISEWLEWANAKADWYDPILSKEDDLLGKREHEKGPSEKELKHVGYW